MHKEYQVVINRTYTTHITLKFPDDGRKHMDIINNKILEGDQGIWDLVAEKELEQMEISDESWEISETHQTRTGGLPPDIGPRF